MIKIVFKDIMTVEKSGNNRKTLDLLVYGTSNNLHQ